MLSNHQSTYCEFFFSKVIEKLCLAELDPNPDLASLSSEEEETSKNLSTNRHHQITTSRIELNLAANRFHPQLK